MEKYRQTNNTIYSLKGSDNTKYNDSDSIISECVNFYQNLYTSKNIPKTDINNYLSNTTITKTLSNDEKLKCEGKINPEECLNFIRNVK